MRRKFNLPLALWLSFLPVPLQTLFSFFLVVPKPIKITFSEIDILKKGAFTNHVDKMR